MNFQTLFLNAVSAVSRKMSKIYFPYTRKYVTSKNFREIENLCQPGDILLSRTRGEITNVVIPGFWSHAALIVNKSSVVEALTNGVQKRDLVEFCLKKDYVTLLRPSAFSVEARATAAQMAEAMVGTKYDFRFQSDSDAFYCSELIYYSYQKAARHFQNVFPLKMRKRFGYETYTPNDLAEDKHIFIPIYSTRLGK